MKVFEKFSLETFQEVDTFRIILHLFSAGKCLQTIFIFNISIGDLIYNYREDDCGAWQKLSFGRHVRNGIEIVSGGSTSIGKFWMRCSSNFLPFHAGVKKFLAESLHGPLWGWRPPPGSRASASDCVLPLSMGNNWNLESHDWKIIDRCLRIFLAWQYVHESVWFACVWMYVRVCLSQCGYVCMSACVCVRVHGCPVNERRI